MSAGETSIRSLPALCVHFNTAKFAHPNISDAGALESITSVLSNKDPANCSTEHHNVRHTLRRVKSGTTGLDCRSIDLDVFLNQRQNMT